MEPLACAGLVKAYGRRRVVDDVSLTLRRGDVYGLVGRNGAGKSTLLRLIAGYARPAAGTVEVFGERMAPGEASARVGALVEAPAVDPGLTGAQNVMVRALALGLPDPRAATARALGSVGLDDASRERVRAYSLGMRQRLGLALALVGSPDVLLLDEPFHGLDPEGVRAVRTLLTRLAAERGVAVLVSSHVLDQLERMATRYGVLCDGRLVRELTADEVEGACADYLLVRSPEAPRALVALEQALPGASLTLLPDDAIRLAGAPGPDEVGRVLLAAGIPVSGLLTHARDIEELFVGLMGDEGEGEEKRREKAGKVGARPGAGAAAGDPGDAAARLGAAMDDARSAGDAGPAGPADLGAPAGEGAGDRRG